MSTITGSDLELTFEDQLSDYSSHVNEFYAIVDVNTVNTREGAHVVEVGVLVLDNNYNVVEKQHTLVNPQCGFKPSQSFDLAADVLQNAPTFGEINSELLSLLHNKILITYGSQFFTPTVNSRIDGKKITDNNVLDLFNHVKNRTPHLTNYSLVNILSSYGVPSGNLNSVPERLDLFLVLLNIVFPTSEEITNITDGTRVSYFNPPSEGYIPFYALWHPRV